MLSKHKSLKEIYRPLAGKKIDPTDPRSIKLVVKGKEEGFDNTANLSNDPSFLTFSVNKKLDFHESVKKNEMNTLSPSKPNLLSIGNTEVDSKTLDFMNNKLF